MKKDQKTPKLVAVVPNDGLDRRSVVRSTVHYWFRRLSLFDWPLLKQTEPFTRRFDFSKVGGYGNLI